MQQLCVSFDTEIYEEKNLLHCEKFKHLILVFCMICHQQIMLIRLKAVKEMLNNSGIFSNRKLLTTHIYTLTNLPLKSVRCKAS